MVDQNIATLSEYAEVYRAAEKATATFRRQYIYFAVQLAEQGYSLADIATASGLSVNEVKEIVEDSSENAVE